MKFIDPSNVGYLCFDFDGVILDTIELKKIAFTKIYNQLSEDQIAYITKYQLSNGGVDRFEKFAHFERHLFGKEASTNRLQNLSFRLSQIVLANICSCEFIKGVMAFIQSAEHSRLPCSIASAMPHDELELILNKLQIRQNFQFATGTPTPKKQQLLCLQRQFTDKKKKGLYFGDTLKDYEAAKFAGLDFIGIGNGHDFSERSIPYVSNFKFVQIKTSDTPT